MLGNPYHCCIAAVYGRGTAVGRVLGVGVGLGVAVAVAVGVGLGVGVGPDSAQYLPPVSKTLTLVLPPHTIIWLPLQTAE